MLLVERLTEDIQMISNRLKEMRKKKNIKVDTLTEKLGISAVYYYDLEKSQRRLNEDWLHKLADFYNVTTDYILGRTDSENNIILEKNTIPEELKPYIDAISIDKEHILKPEEIKILIETALKLKACN